MTRQIGTGAQVGTRRAARAVPASRWAAWRWGPGSPAGRSVWRVPRARRIANRTRRTSRGCILHTPYTSRGRIVVVPGRGREVPRRLPLPLPRGRSCSDTWRRGGARRCCTRPGARRPPGSGCGCCSGASGAGGRGSPSAGPGTGDMPPLCRPQADGHSSRRSIRARSWPVPSLPVPPVRPPRPGIAPRPSHPLGTQGLCGTIGQSAAPASPLLPCSTPPLP